MTFNLNAKTFWTSATGAIQVGASLVRYGYTAAPVAVGAVDASRAALRKGVTTFAAVANRIVWFSHDAGGNTVLSFSAQSTVENAISGNNAAQYGSDSNGFAAQDFEGRHGFAVSAAFSGLVSKGFADTRNPLDVAGRPSILVKPLSQTQYFGSGAGGATYTRAGLAEYALRNPTKTMKVFNVNGDLVENDCHFHVIYVGGGPGSTVLANGWGNMSLSLPLAAASTAVRARLGLGKSVVAGFFTLPVAEDAALLGSGFVAGVHRSIRAIRLLPESEDLLGGPVQGDAIYAAFSPAEIVAILQGQRTYAEPTDQGHIDSLILAVQSLNTPEFRLLILREPTGPLDIMQSNVIQKAIQEGATEQDVLETVVSGKTVAAWRAECLVGQPVRALLWLAPAAHGVPGVSSVVGSLTADPTIYPTPSAGQRVIVDEAQAAVAYSYYLLRDPPVQPPAPSAQPADLGVLNNGCVVEFNTAAGLSMFGKVSDGLAAEPWTDLPAIWWHRQSTRQLQGLANSLAFAITEPALWFGAEEISQ